MRSDITNESDVKLMVDCFYQKVNKDEMLSPIFNGVAKVDWGEHLPIMYSFWNNVLFSTGEYNRRPFPKHIPLPIDNQHFERWLLLFNENLDELFIGPVAEKARFRAKNIALIFSIKLNHLKQDNQLI